MRQRFLNTFKVALLKEILNTKICACFYENTYEFRNLYGKRHQNFSEFLYVFVNNHVSTMVTTLWTEKNPPKYTGHGRFMEQFSES
jgi:hypothetical protein